MEYDAYKPPQADLTTDLAEEPDFYVVSETKFLILAIATLGLYYLYWFYKHWKNQKIKHNESIWPVARTIFSIFFTHSLFRRIQEKLNADNKSFAWSHSLMATIYVVAAIIGYVTDQGSTLGPSAAMLSLASFATLIPMVWSTYKAQQAANLAMDDPAGAQNSDITPANIAWILLGVAFWGLALFGLYAQMIGMPLE